MSPKAYLGNFHFDLEDALHDRVSEARRNDPFSPITVLVGSNILAVYLRRRLAARAGGLFNIRFVTFADLAATIARGASARVRAPLPPYAEQAIVEDLLRCGEVAVRFGESSRTKGFADALVATFTDLAEAGYTPASAREALTRAALESRLGERARVVLSLFARFRERVEELGHDIHAIFAEAVGAPVPASIGEPLYAYGFYDLNELQWRLLMRLAEARDLSFFMPWGEGDARRFAGRMRERLERSGFETIILGGRGGGAKRAEIPRLLNVPSEEEEIREIARRMLALARERAFRFGEMAILLPSVEPYVPLCREILGEAGIPYFMSAGSFAASSLPAKSVIGLLGMLGGTMERRELAEFLVSAPLRSAGADLGTSDRCANWVRRSAEAGILGEKGWTEENAAFVERLQAEVERGEGDEEALESARHVDILIRRIVNARDAVRKTATWSGYAAIVSALTADLFRESEDTGTVSEIVGRLAELDAIGAPVSFDAFSRLATAALSQGGVSVGRFGGEGVNVLTLEQARGLSFRAVFIPGLAERIFPTAVRQDPFLNDQERRELGRIAGGTMALSEKCGRLSEEALLFDLARGSAQDVLVCSYPRFEEGTAKDRIPSSFLRFVDGYSIDGAHGESLAYECIPRGGSPPPKGEILSEHDLDFRKACEYRDGAGFLSDNAFFLSGAKLVKKRWGTRMFTEYDGAFSSKGAIGELQRMLDERGWRFAPTALERYAACPFDYFCSQVLGIEVLEEPERILSISRLSRGVLIHTILARVFRELKERKLLPVRHSPAGRVDEVAEEVTTSLLEHFPKTEPVGLPVFWEMEKRLIRESIRLLLEEERFEEGDFVPTHFERSFGRERNGIEVSYECAGREIFLYGRIDRIDLGGDGGFRVIDYKTGMLTGANQDFVQGTALQLPVYLMAASRMLDRPVERGEALYRRVGTGPGRRAVLFSGGAWRDSEGEFARIMSTVITGIANGLFVAPADEQGCRNCSVKAACPAGMPRLFALKAAHDARVRGYVDMRSGRGGAQ